MFCLFWNNILNYVTHGNHFHQKYSPLPLARGAGARPHANSDLGRVVLSAGAHAAADRGRARMVVELRHGRILGRPVHRRVRRAARGERAAAGHAARERGRGGGDGVGMGGSVLDDASVAGGSAMDDDLLARQQELRVEIDRIEERSRQNRERAMASASAAAAQPVPPAVAAAMERLSETPFSEGTRKKWMT